MEDIQAVRPSVVVTANDVYAAAYHITDFFVSRSGADTIPYVADFTSPFVNNPTPRPFYCTRFVDDIGNPTAGQPSFFDAHDWYLFTMPDNVTVPVNDLYIDEQWSW
jgi:hypothetical protein